MVSPALGEGAPICVRVMRVIIVITAQGMKRSASAKCHREKTVECGSDRTALNGMVREVSELRSRNKKSKA